MKRWKCKSSCEFMLEYYTPGTVYAELGDGSIETNNHSHYGEWSSFSHENGVIEEDGEVLVIFCEV